MDVENAVTNPVTQSNDVCAEKRTYTVVEISDLLQISRSKAYEICSMDLFRIIRIGRSVRISKASFDEWLDTRLNDKECVKYGINTK